MYKAYADHRPFVLSPDMIWLLISQGFAMHTKANPEILRKKFVDFEGKKTLVVKTGYDLLLDSTKWDQIFPEFTKQIANNTGADFVENMTANFSTTTNIEKIASQITVMKTMEPYFEYVIISSICGIPEVTLKGTTEDWEKVLFKTKQLGKYKLSWWTKQLEPILNEFIKASKGNVNKVFWRNMFKYHSEKVYGAPKIIDGWIVKLFPYSDKGKRLDLVKLVEGKELPHEMLKVDVKYIRIDTNSIDTTMLEAWAGFVGLEQNPVTFALTPKISWMIKKKDVTNKMLVQKLESTNIPCSWCTGLYLEVDEVPEVFKNFNQIFRLDLKFKNKVSIPYWLKNVKIGYFSINGKISEKETREIMSWFPNTLLIINDKTYNSVPKGWINVVGDEIARKVLHLKEIWVLEIFLQIKIKYYLRNWGR